MRVSTVSMLTENRPGVLARICQLFSRRGFNLLSVCAERTDRFEVYCITVVVRCDDDATLDQIRKQLQKLIDVVHATDHTGDDAYETEIALVKLRADLHERTEILQVAENFGAKVTDYGQDSLMLRVYGASDKLDAFIALLRPYGMRELVRSGKILMVRGLHET